jgi:hypothetical protein
MLITMLINYSYFGKNHSAHYTRQTVLFTDLETILARNVIDVHVQDFIANDKFLLPILKAFTQCTCPLHTTQNT